jgi:hypothetical protein
MVARALAMRPAAEPVRRMYAYLPGAVVVRSLAQPLARCACLCSLGHVLRAKELQRLLERTTATKMRYCCSCTQTPCGSPSDSPLTGPRTRWHCADQHCSTSVQFVHAVVQAYRKRAPLRVAYGPLRRSRCACMAFEHRIAVECFYGRLRLSMTLPSRPWH